ncbi:hypothetical protein CNMCM7691_003887 [Aspergillus felis]|uniref:Ankyrin repeat protein n=1 Tax=Aspergillus felis TaxID=1287682 RepID=A0A8H6R2V2_9EURO|nr:hypothetical protein CNMCM7691_003887 [Aspergillus felis]
MSLLVLPNEMFLSIAQSLDCARDISSLARVNKRTYWVLVSTLYHFNIQQQEASALHWAAKNGRPLMAVTMLVEYHYDVNAIYLTNTPLVDAVIHGSTTVVDVLLARPHVDVNFQNKRGECALWWAAYLGHTDIVELLLRCDDIEVDIADREGCLTPLSLAVVGGHRRIVQHLLETHRVNVNAFDQHGRPLIFRVISTKDQKMMEILLRDENLNVSCRDGYGRTPLHYSVSNGQTELTTVLLGHPGTDVDVRDNKDRTPLWHAVRLGNEQIVQVLLENGANSSVPDIEMITPLQKSIMKGKPSILQMLLKNYHGNYSAFMVDENGDGSDEQALLCLAATWNRSEMARWLLDHGWDVNEKDADERTPLLLAAEAGYSSVVQVLLGHPQINVHAHDYWRSTALHEAAKRGYLEVVELLLAKGSIDINAKDKNGVTPLWWATGGHHYKVAARLLDEPDVDVNAVSRIERPLPDRSTSLHHTVQGRDMSIIRRLLTKETLDPNVADHQKWTPLGWAADQGDVETVELLLTRPNIQVNGLEHKEAPPLCLAARRGHTQVVRRLLQCPGIDMDQGWGAYLPPLLAAITEGHSNVAMQLLACGKRLNVNVQTYSKESALSLAARQGDLQVVNSILCDCRTDRNSVDDRGRTALWWAAHAGKSAVVERFLLDDDIRVDMRDDDGIDALNAASQQYHFDIVRLLRTHRPEHHRGIGFSRQRMASNE